MIYQTGKIVSDGWTAARNDSSKSWEEEEEEEGERRRREKKENASTSHLARTHHVSVSLPTSSHLYILYARCAHVCVCVRARRHMWVNGWLRTHCVDPLIRGLIGRAGAIECQTGRTLRKSPVGAVSRVFLTESSRTRAAGNSIRCPCTAGSLSRQREASGGISDVSHTGTLGTLPTRASARTAWQLEETHEECPRAWRTPPPYGSLRSRSSSRTNSASPNMGRILRIPRARASSGFLPSPVDNFSIGLQVNANRSVTAVNEQQVGLTPVQSVPWPLPRLIVCITFNAAARYFK